LGGRRDSAAQISGQSPPSTSPPPTNRNRRRSSLAQLTDILREWSGTGPKRNQKPPLNRRETLADLARSLPWHRISNDQYTSTPSHAPPLQKRRESSCDSGIKSMRSRRDSHNSELAKIWNRKDQEKEKENQEIPGVSVSTEQSVTRNGSRRGSGDSSNRGSRRESTQMGSAVSVKVIGVQRKRRDSLAAPEMPNFRQEQRPSTSSGDSSQLYSSHQVDSSCQSIPMPTIIMSSVSPPATSPSPKFEMVKSGRRDSTTQCNSRMNRRESRLQRQATAYDESCTPTYSRRGSQPQQPALSPSEGGPSEGGSLCERQARRDSLSPEINTSK
jgi:hypothetical protein